MSGVAAFPEARAMGERLICSFEGCRLAPYQDVAGVWTIGWGSIAIDGVPVTEATPAISQLRADQLRAVELGAKCDAVDAAVSVDLTDGQRAALYSFAYNEGVHAFQTSTLLRLLNAGDFDGAAAEFPKWIYAGGRRIDGLANRRLREAAVFCGEADM